MRNRSGMSRGTIPPFTSRFLVLVPACPPIPTRPDFRPDPRALTVVLDARPERVTTVLDSLVAAESLEVAHANVRDGYVERSEEHTSELQSPCNLVCRLLLEKKKKQSVRDHKRKV